MSKEAKIFLFGVDVGIPIGAVVAIVAFLLEQECGTYD
jgi:hypothetical protein